LPLRQARTGKNGRSRPIRRGLPRFPTNDPASRKGEKVDLLLLKSKKSAIEAISNEYCP
jgi:hypothetical protein